MEVDFVVENDIWRIQKEMESWGQSIVGERLGSRFILVIVECNEEIDFFR